jgi:hypothetical protein
MKRTVREHGIKSFIIKRYLLSAALDVFCSFVHSVIICIPFCKLNNWGLYSYTHILYKAAWDHAL